MHKSDAAKWNFHIIIVLLTPVLADKPKSHVTSVKKGLSLNCIMQYICTEASTFGFCAFTH